MLLHEDSRQYTTINTHRGLFEFCRLPFGISSAPAIFQWLMDTLFQGLPKVCVYLDDILVAGVDEADHLSNFSKVLDKLDGDGLYPSPSKVEAVKRAPVSINITELRSFLGLINYYHKFLPQFSTTLAPLYQLLHKDSKWQWTTTNDQAYQKAKELLQSSISPSAL